MTPNFHGAVGGRVPILVDSVPGPVYQFGAIIENQEPNARLRPEFLPRRFAALRGETYDPEKLKDLYRNLYLTGLYDTIDVQEVPQPDNTIQLVANPQEAKPKELGFYGGYDTFDGVIFGANYTNRNIDGLGRIFSFRLNYTGRGPDGEISYENPWFLEKNIDFSAALGVSAKELIGYSIQNYYARVRFTKTFRKGIQTVAFLQAKQAECKLDCDRARVPGRSDQLSAGYLGIVANVRFPGQSNQPAQGLGVRCLGIFFREPRWKCQFHSLHRSIFDLLQFRQNAPGARCQSRLHECRPRRRWSPD